MKKMIFGSLLFIGGLFSATAVICASLVSNSTYAPAVFKNDAVLALNTFIIISVIGFVIILIEAYELKK